MMMNLDLGCSIIFKQSMTNPLYALPGDRGFEHFQKVTPPAIDGLSNWWSIGPQ